MDATLIKGIQELNIDAYSNGDRISQLVLWEEGALRADYAPFDYVEQKAEIVIVGLTPGRSQASNALRKFQQEIIAGSSLDAALKAAKVFASFSGAMRSSLVSMLDEIGIPSVYGRRSSEQFFVPNSGLAHFTSALRYPVYFKNQNYSGNPSPLRTPVLRRMVDRYLAAEVKALPNAVWIPLGRHAEEALAYLVEKGELNHSHVLSGMPHPSGANSERIAYFLGRKEKSLLSAKTNPEKIEFAKTALVKKVALLRNARQT